MSIIIYLSPLRFIFCEIIYFILCLTEYCMVLDQINDEEHHCNDKITAVSNDDFREECENCKHDQELAGGYDDIFPEPETMTLERRPQLTHEHGVDGIEPRSSMTLPGDGRLRRYYNFLLYVYILCSFNTF